MSASNPQSSMPGRRAWLFQAAGLAGGLVAGLGASRAQAAGCRGTLYLTFDTGSMSVAELVADTLRRHGVRATFFVANEKTTRGDFSLDPSWAGYWKRLVDDGHAFGTHTFDHVYWVGDAGRDKVRVRPQFGSRAGQTQVWGANEYCAELRRAADRFTELTGKPIDPFWRAPGGKTSPTLLRFGTQCGLRHAGWSPAGFLGDELSSEAYPNVVLLKRALDNLRDGDIAVAHLGIWSRRDPWAPAVLDPLIAGLKRRGFCFATLREHPDYRR